MISHNLSFLEWSEHRFQGKMTLTHGLEPNAAAKTDFQPKRRQVEYHNSGHVRWPKKDYVRVWLLIMLKAGVHWGSRILTDDWNYRPTQRVPGVQVSFFSRIIINIKKLNRNLTLAVVWNYSMGPLGVAGYAIVDPAWPLHTRPVGAFFWRTVGAISR